MKIYKEYKGLDLPQIDQQFLTYWSEDETFKKSLEQRDKNNRFVFFEGPPSANGKPGIHHVLARTIKDTFCRYQVMKGKYVQRKAGWDTHGLPIELAVEKKLGITKEDIGSKISVDDYNTECKETVMMYKDLWDDLTHKMGYWVDMNDPYITYENSYIETVWYLLQRLYNKDLLYKGYTIQPYSPAAGTGLSTHELNQPGCYKDVSDTTVTAQFKCLDASFPENTYFLAWTTTPWTLPSNTALTVGPNIDYNLIETYNQYTHEPIYIVLAKKLNQKVLPKKYVLNDDLTTYSKGNKQIPYRIIKEFKGADICGMKYEQLLPYTLPYYDADKAFTVIAGDFVTTEDGTGIVHTAPTFGADDAKAAKAAGVPPMLILDENDNPVPLVDLQGRFRKEMGEFGGKFVKNEYYNDHDRPEKSIDVEIAIKLKTENKAFIVEKYAHNYPHCWRTDKPVLYYPLDSWFVKTTACKDRMIELNNTINWKPKSTGEGRFGKWLENIQDWNLSRSRYWGIPLPIWRNEEGDKEKCIGSINELQKEIELANQKLGIDQQVPKDLHRPYIDDVVLVSDTGEKLIREKDLIDVWFDSGSMPYAQWHYPFENKELIENGEMFPADFIAEGVDQTRGWFYTLHAIATMCFDSVAYKNVVSNGLVLDRSGMKMSKSKGNVVEPFETLGKYGADATRWYMITNAQPWDNLKFDQKGLEETQRKLFGTLYNTYSFFATYANVDQFNGFGFHSETVRQSISTEQHAEIDRWILSLLNSLIQEVNADYANYEPTNAGRKIFEFVDRHLSNWYVRLCRRRFWKGEKNTDKLSAYYTLSECLLSVSKLMAPIAPFFSDWLYTNLTNQTSLESHTSVHLSYFPEVDSNKINTELEEKMSYAQRITSLILSLRKKENIRVRQPLQKVLIPVLSDTFKKQVQAIEDLIKSEVNVKEIEYVSGESSIIKKVIKPNFKSLGKRLGKLMGKAKGIIEQMTPTQIAELEQHGLYKLIIDDQSFDITLEDVMITSSDIEGWLVANDNELTVALDIQIDTSLKNEGLAREIVNRIQNIRKEKKFEVTDRIKVTIGSHNDLSVAIDEYEGYITNEVLSDELIISEQVNGPQIDLVDGISVAIDVQRLG